MYKEELFRKWDLLSKTTNSKVLIATIILLIFNSCAFTSQSDVNAVLIKARKGGVEAQYQLAKAYENGEGVNKDFDEALKWYKQAASNGYPPAQIDLGWFYQEGYGVTQNSQKAIEWYAKAVAQNNAQAMFNIGWIYDQGIGINENNDKASQWYKQAAEQGNHRAQLNLGIMLAFGKEIKLDYIEAYKWLTIVRIHAPEKNARWKARGVLDEIIPSMNKKQIEEGTIKANEWINNNKK
ncbi:MAG: tetratricopeptide repeat protein [bacterium]